ncbi:hypothetical protein EYF80_016535 [Liparis tanakae]|uniref:Uncharacterized protein n=1 Tax=Liparis tanakae TaxID=230148 RepID=A0A4Z2I7A8_9TELE|nr:hypothetical protein EYF80_016535 [Liparis tanakae]
MTKCKNLKIETHVTAVSSNLEGDPPPPQSPPGSNSLLHHHHHHHQGFCPLFILVQDRAQQSSRPEQAPVVVV